MFSKIRGIVFLAIILGLIGLFQIGCNRDSGENPFAAPISGSGSAINNANVFFKLVFPQKDSGTQSANILPAMDAPAIVNFQIKLLNYGNTSNPFFIISKQVPVVNGSASAIFESLPTTTILGQIHIENGKIQGYSDFHGALDLIQGENTVTLAPVGSLMPQDVVAKALNEIISSSTLFLNAPQSLVSELDKIVSVLLLDSSVAYDEVINNFNNRNGLPLVEIISPTTDQSFVTGDNISIVASATDLDGVISKIEFFHGSEKIGEAQASPFSCSWKPLSDGTYSLTAKAFDNNSAVSYTPPVTINVISHYSVFYNGNGHTAGAIPIDSQTYRKNTIAAVKDNTGGLVKNGFIFSGWNTAADGSGTNYDAGASLTVGTADIVLFAKWVIEPKRLNIEYGARNGLTVTLQSFVKEDTGGYYNYTVTYTQKNNTTTPIDEGQMKLYLSNNTGLPQYGFFNKLYPGDTQWRSYTFKVLYADSSAWILEYDHENFFSTSPVAGSLRWEIPIPN
ncbi:hypothetical protein MASR1M12_27670 [Erysipelotrichia bacterium]